MKTLYAMSADVIALAELLDEMGGDISAPEAEAAFDSWAKELGDNEAVKLGGVVAWLAQLDMEAKRAWEESVAYSAMAKQKEAIAERITQAITAYLTATGRKKYTTPNGRTISVCANGGKQPIEIDTVDPETIPAQYRKQRLEIDRAAVREGLESGYWLPWARLRPCGTHVRITPKPKGGN